MATPNPVSVASVKATLASPSSNACARFTSALLQFPVLFVRWYSWAVTALGVFSVDYKRDSNFLKAGDKIESFAPLAEVTGEGGRLLCNGQEVSKATYPTLYAAIGDTWGVPSSSANFKLPDCSERFPVCVGGGSSNGGPYALGDTGGEADVVLETANLPAHTHPPGANMDTFMGLATATGDTGAAGGSAFEDGATETGSTGSGTAHENRPPFYAVYVYIVA